jgi:hypothetical protein
VKCCDFVLPRRGSSCERQPDTGSERERASDKQPAGGRQRERQQQQRQTGRAATKHETTTTTTRRWRRRARQHEQRRRRSWVASGRGPVDGSRHGWAGIRTTTRRRQRPTIRARDDAERHGTTGRCNESIPSRHIEWRRSSARPASCAFSSTATRAPPGWHAARLAQSPPLPRAPRLRLRMARQVGTRVRIRNQRGDARPGPWLLLVRDTSRNDDIGKYKKTETRASSDVSSGASTRTPQSPHCLLASQRGQRRQTPHSSFRLGYIDPKRLSRRAPKPYTHTRRRHGSPEVLQTIQDTAVSSSCLSVVVENTLIRPGLFAPAVSATPPDRDLGSASNALP